MNAVSFVNTDDFQSQIADAYKHIRNVECSIYRLNETFDNCKSIPCDNEEDFDDAETVIYKSDSEEIHHRPRPFVCNHENCLKSFEKRDRLIQHKYTHNPKGLECGICNKKFTHKTTLCSHKKKFHPAK